MKGLNVKGNFWVNEWMRGAGDEKNIESFDWTQDKHPTRNKEPQE